MFSSTRIRRLSRGLLLSLTLTLALAHQVSAGPWDDFKNATRDIICGIYVVFRGIVGPLAVLVFVIAGVQWIVSRDDPAKRKQAQDAMIVIVIGALMVGLVGPVLGGIWSSVTGTVPLTCGP